MSKRPFKQLAVGEFISRTQKQIGRVSTDALKVRTNGITQLRAEIVASVAGYAECKDEQSFEDQRSVTKELISAMNVSCRDAEKELALRAKRK